MLNAANEVAVAAFLGGQAAFTDIAAIVDRMLMLAMPEAPTTLDSVLAIDAETRVRTRELLEFASSD